MDPLQSMLAFLDSLAPLSVTDRTVLTELPVLRTLEKGGFFHRSDDIPFTIGYVYSGWLKYFYTDAEGKEYIRYFCHGGHMVASSSALVTKKPSAYAIQALTSVELLVFDYDSLTSRLATSPAWRTIRETLQDQVIQRSEERERALILDNALKRYLALLRDFPGIEANVRQYDIASYLGITPIALSRLRSQTL